MNTEIYPRALVFANNCFSKTNSNGRTLAGFFDGFPKDKLAQFYIQSDTPDFELCNDYYCVTDAQALKSYFKRKPYGGIKNENDFNYTNEPQSNKRHRKIKKTPISMKIRERVWNARYWKGIAFDEWVSSFSPQIIILQAGDSAFMMKLATDIAMQRNIPLVIYNSEDYYFKTKNYMKGAKASGIFYKSFIKKFKKSFDYAIDYASASIYSSELLKRAYDEKFNKKSYFLYTSTKVREKNSMKNDEEVKVSYLGNLGVGRHESLIAIANSLTQINPSYKLDVYGKIPNNLVKKALDNCAGISYKGFISYDNVVEVMKSSTILVHAENFSNFYKEDLKYAFSTKIADTMACGTCLFYYAPEGLASTEYLKANECACVVTDEKDLLISLKNILSDKEKREAYIKNALGCVKVNHSSEKNRIEFLKILNDCLK